jgi:hypothetical protein
MKETPYQFNGRHLYAALQGGVREDMGGKLSPSFEDYYGGFNDMPPNWKPIDSDEFWQQFSMHGAGLRQQFRQIIVSAKKREAFSAHLFFYNDGTGLAVQVKWGMHAGGSRSKWTPVFYKFALCEHERVGTVDTVRGWHEGYCSKCGMVMNYDSGD